MNISKLENVLNELFEINENIGDDVGIVVKRPEIDGMCQYRVVYGDSIYSGRIWRGLSDEIYIDGKLFDEA